MKRILRITSYTGLSRYLATLTEDGWIVRQPVNREAA
jgi:hypothetical protein